VFNAQEVSDAELCLMCVYAQECLMCVSCIQEVSDAELLEAARSDPDLAALLRGESVDGLDLDRAIDRYVCVCVCLGTCVCVSCVVWTWTGPLTGMYVCVFVWVRVCHV
jgi:hypothetical protein